MPVPPSPKVVSELVANFQAPTLAHPTLAALHVGAAAAWSLALPVSRSAEGVLFGVLLAVSLVQLPWTWRILARTLAEPLALCILAWVLLTVGVTLQASGWTDYETVLPGRQFLLPLLLLPVAHRWRLLLVAFAAGAVATTVHGSILAGLVLWHGGSVQQAEQPSPSRSLAIVLLAGLTGLLTRRGRRHLATWGLLLLAVFASATFANRRAIVGVAAAAATMLFEASRRLRPLTRWLLIATAAATMLAGISGPLLFGKRPVAVAVSTLARADATPDSRLSSQTRIAAIADIISSGRIRFWAATAEAIADRPWIGHGRGVWNPTIASLESSVRSGLARDLVRTSSRDSHNLALDLLFESGIAGLLLWLGVGVFGVRTALRRLPSEPALAICLAMLTGWLASSMFDYPWARGLSAGIFFLFASITLFTRPSQRAFREAGLGVEDDWVDGWLPPPRR
jgi:O-antigen ligase